MQQIKKAVLWLEKRYHSHPHLVARGLFILCALSLAASLYMLLYLPTPKNYVRTSGRVSSINSAYTGSTAAVGTYTVITFTDSAQTEIRFNGLPHDKPLHAVGDTVPVAYSTKNSRVARDLSDRTVPFYAYLLIAIPVISVIVLAGEKFYFWWEAYDIKEGAGGDDEGKTDKVEGDS